MQAVKQKQTILDVDLWKSNLRDAVISAKSRNDAIALKCFEKALAPLLERPENLRTLLGKIASS